MVNEFPPLVRMMIGLTIMLLAPLVSRRCRMPDVVGLIIAGIVFGPYMIGIGRSEAPVLASFAEIGKLLLLFFAGMEIDLVLFGKARWRASFFGVATLAIPLAAGTALGLSFGYSPVSAVLIGSILASHTLLGFPIVQKYRIVDKESTVVAIGATIFTDTISLIILAICVSIHTMGFEPVQTTWQVLQIILYVFIVLVVVSRAVRWYVETHHPEQEIQMLALLLVVMIAATLGEMIHLEGIVGAFMAGLAVNKCLRGTKTHEHIEVIGKTLFVPAFFLTIGMGLDLPNIWQSIVGYFPFVVALTATLVCAKFLAACLTGLTFRYRRDEWLNLWSLSLPQVAATIAAALVAYESLDASGNRLIDQTVMSGVLVMVIVTAIGGPILTDVFCRRIVSLPGGGSDGMGGGGGGHGDPGR